MIFQFLEKKTSPKRSPYSVSDGVIITLIANGKKLTNGLDKKTRNKLSHVSLAILAQVTPSSFSLALSFLTVLRSRFPRHRQLFHLWLGGRHN